MIPSNFKRNFILKISGVLGRVFNNPSGYIILMYHRLSKDEDFPYEIDKELSVKLSDFDKQMKFISKHYNVISLEEMVNRIKRNEKINKLSFVVTFDDGYADNYLLGKSILEKYNINATIFITTDFIDTGIIPFWDKIKLFLKTPSNANQVNKYLKNDEKFDFSKLNGRIQFFKFCSKIIYNNDPLGSELLEIIDDYLLKNSITDGIFFDWEMIKKASKSENFTFGCHTCGHKRFDLLGNDLITREINESKIILENKLNIPINLFSYPFGGGNSAPDLSVQEILKNSGFRCALMNNIGVNKNHDNLFMLKRLAVLGDEDFVKFQNRISLSNFLSYF